MTEILKLISSDDLSAFTSIAGFIVVLLLLEGILLLFGMSSDLGLDDLDADGDANFEGVSGSTTGFTSDIADMSLDVGQLMPYELDMIELPEAQTQFTPQKPSFVRRAFGAIGLGNGPLLIGLAVIAMMVSSIGFFIQITMHNMFGWMFSGMTKFVVVLPPALFLAGKMTRLLSDLIPSVETYAVSSKTYNGRRGYVVIGVSERGSPAQVRYKDLYGNTHEVMAEPLRDGEKIVSGTEVMIVKPRGIDPKPMIVATH